jgi:hypothetical protein
MSDRTLAGTTCALGLLRAKEQCSAARSDVGHCGDRTCRDKTNAADVACTERKPALTGRVPASGHVRPGASGRVFVALDPYCK